MNNIIDVNNYGQLEELTMAENIQTNGGGWGARFVGLGIGSGIALSLCGGAGLIYAYYNYISNEI